MLVSIIWMDRAQVQVEVGSVKLGARAARPKVLFPLQRRVPEGNSVDAARRVLASPSPPGEVARFFLNVPSIEIQVILEHLRNWQLRYILAYMIVVPLALVGFAARLSSSLVAAAVLGHASLALLALRTRPSLPPPPLLSRCRLFTFVIIFGPAIGFHSTISTGRRRQ